jgi:hypothetical protein
VKPVGEAARNMMPRHKILVILCVLLILFFVGYKHIANFLDKSSIYEEQLKSAIANTTLIKVSPVFFGEVQQMTGEVSFEETDAKKIQKIIENIKITPFGYGGACECLGDQSIEFYSGERLCAELTFHHGKHFRWQKGWPSDMILTNKSAEYFKKWLFENGNYKFR